MCGIAGLVRTGGLGPGDRTVLERMCMAIEHRGPDAHGYWTDDAAGVGLGHLRLSILDLSEAGAQPMGSPDGRLVLTFNGEIYNYLTLRTALEAEDPTLTWKGHSDTEVLLAAISRWGLEKALREAEGMFALGLYDRKLGTLDLARDRFGEKPLYVAHNGAEIQFASELKALMAHPAWQGEIDRQAISLCVRHGYIPAPRTAFQNVCKVMPGEIVTIRLESPAPSEWQRARFHDPLGEALHARNNRFQGTGAEAVERLDDLLRAAVERQMISDVPLGAFLSGGIDSSTIAAIMQSLKSTPVETFSLGFEEKEVDEAGFARRVAANIGTSHNEVILDGREARDLVAQMPDVYDEPFADQSQLPTYLLARFARQKVTVSLSGDAADELFAGYGRYHSINRKWDGSLLGGLTKQAQGAYASALLNAVYRPAAAAGIEKLAGKSVAGEALRQSEKVRRFSATSAEDAFEQSFTQIDAADLLVPGTARERHRHLADLAGGQDWSVLEKTSFLDLTHYLPDDILVKVDRASMAHALEVRVPFLDPSVVRFALSLKDEHRLHGGDRKGVLKGVLAKYVPEALWDRPKRGFGIPSAAWLAGPLRDLAGDMFAADTLERVGVLDPKLTATLWNEFLGGQKRRANLIWTLFVVQLYLQRHTG